MKLTRDRQAQARAFIFEAARPLEQAQYAYHFENGTAEAVLASLARFQNADGGFGHALEPDLRVADSSALATTIGLQILRDIEATAEQPMVRGAIGYLLASYDPRQQRWPIIPATAGSAPHAPWWEPGIQLQQSFGAFLANPRAEIIGYLYEYAELVPGELLETLGPAALAHLEQLPDKMDMHDLLCYVRLAETKTLPEPMRERMMDKLRRAVGVTVERDPAAWKTYGLQPLAVVTTPDSPFAALYGRELEANLDALVESQQDDGSWGLTWTWGDMFPEAWQVAERDWRGVLTLTNLRTLRSFGRLE